MTTRSPVLDRTDLAGILDALPSLVTFVDEEGRNRYANRSAEHWLGRSPGELHGASIREVLGEEGYLAVGEHRQGAMRDEPCSFVSPRRLPDGSFVHARTDYLPRLRGGRPAGFLVLVTDVTRQVDAEVAHREGQARTQAAAHASDTVLQELFAIGLHLERLGRASDTELDGAAALVDALGSTIDRLRASIKALVASADRGVPSQLAGPAT